MNPIPPNSAAARSEVGSMPMHLPEVVEQAEQLIKFCKSLQGIEVPQFNGDSVAQATSIRLWMESSEEIQHLEVLYLSDRFLSHLPPEIGLFRSLKVLDVSNNQIITLPPEIGNLRELKVLNAAHNRLKEIPVEIGHFKKLDVLNISRNQIEILPVEIVSFEVLSCLNISDNQLKTFPAEIGSLTKLTTLDVSKNCLETLPADIGSLRKLKVLKVAGNKLKTLPAGMGNLIALQRLYASENLLGIFPAEIISLRKLHALDLSENQLQEIPAEIGRCGKLTFLNISGNRLETLPAEMGHLSQLAHLDASGNRLETLFAETENLWKLNYLNISMNRFKIFPIEVFHLGNLDLLSISFNQLKTLPPAIGNLIELHTLDVSQNRLETVPSEIGNLRKLVWLYFSHNHLETLPAEMENLQALSFIDLSYNQLVALPVEMKKLVQLQQGVFDHNRFQPLIYQLQRWSSLFEVTFPQDGEPRLRGHRLYLQMLSLNDEQQMLSKYLQKLEQLMRALEQSDARGNIILRVERMIQLAGKNVEFGHIMLAQIADGLEACGDRALLTFNEIEIQWQFHHKELDDAEFRSLAIRAGRYELVKQHAIKVAVAMGFGDHVETILGFHLGLREALELPITMTEMLYQGASGVTAQMLGSAKAMIDGYTDEQVLAHSEHWKSRMTQKYPAQAEEVDVKYGEWGELAQLFFQSPELVEILLRSGDYSAAMKAIAAKRSEALAGLGTVNSAAAADQNL